MYTQKCASSCVPSAVNTVTVKCCQKNDCNKVLIKGKVDSCYVGGYSSLLQPDGLGIEIPVSKKLCVSPKNQYCIVNYSVIYFLLWHTMLNNFQNVRLSTKVNRGNGRGKRRFHNRLKRMFG